MIGQKFERLTVLERDKSRGTKNTYYIVACVCGNEKSVRKTNLLSRNTRSCGCLKIEDNKSRSTHGMTNISEYKIWSGMKQRCNNKNQESWNDYGGRGILVCERWSNSFENFLEDMGERPGEGFSLDRIDVNGNYEPSNCRWADMQTQMNNTTNVINIEFNGETHNIAEWATIMDINESTLRDRINGRHRSSKWSVERALTEPIRQLKRR